MAAVSTGVVALLVFASVGLAAWMIWGGLYGNGASKFSSTTNAGSAIQFSNGVVPTGDLYPGNPGSLTTDLIVNDPSPAHVYTIASVNSGAVNIDVPGNAACVAHIAFNGAALVGFSAPGGTNEPGHVFPGVLVADASTPLSCAGQTVELSNITGTTTGP
jgi:hypothetical protein